MKINKKKIIKASFIPSLALLALGARKISEENLQGYYRRLQMGANLLSQRILFIQKPDFTEIKMNEIEMDPLKVSFKLAEKKSNLYAENSLFVEPPPKASTVKPPETISKNLLSEGSKLPPTQISKSKSPAIRPKIASKPAAKHESWMEKLSISNLASGFKSNETEKKKNYRSYPVPKRISLSHTEGNGGNQREFGTNYTMLEFQLASDAKLGSFISQIDLRGYRFDNATYAFSGGYVGRYVPEADSFCNLLGLNLYYDYRQGTPGHIQQISGGVEVIGKRLDFRGNFYAPIGSNRHLGDCCSLRCINGWFGFGYNAEVGWLAVRSKKFLLYTAAGPYYVSSEGCEERKRGGMLRVVPQYKDYFALDMRLTYDSIFKTIFQAEFIVSLPLYKIRANEGGPCGITTRQLYQRVERMH